MSSETRRNGRTSARDGYRALGLRPREENLLGCCAVLGCEGVEGCSERTVGAAGDGAKGGYESEVEMMTGRAETYMSGL